MGIFDTLIKRNKDFAVEQSASGLLMPALPRALPNVKALIIGCADMRVDPAHVLAIEPGEAVVLRNIGGRVTPGTLRMLGLLGRIGQVAGEIPGGGNEFCLIVLHHTDCGITRLAGDSDMLTDYFETPKRNYWPRQSQTPVLRLLSMWLLSGQPPPFPVSGLFPGLSTMWQRD